MTLLQHELTDFTVNAYQNDAFHEVSKADVLGHWSVFFFYPADFTFVCPTELEDLAAKYDEFKPSAARSTRCPATPTSCTRPGTTPTRRSPRSSTRCWPIRPPRWPRDLDTYNEALGQAERGDFIVNPEGKVVAYEVISSNVGRNADELLRRVQASQFVYEHGDQVCPAKWQPGDETIEPTLDLVGQL